jgi:type IV pilus assembly protein PilQ
MKGLIQRQSGGTPRVFDGRGSMCRGPRPSRTQGVPPSAARGAVVIACALIVCGANVRPAAAQSSRLHRAFADVDAGDGNAAAEEPRPGTVRLASGQQPPARSATSPQSPTHKPIRAKASAPTTVERKPTQAPEELPTLPMKAIVPLAGAVQGDGLSLTQEKKGNITLIVRDKPLSQVLALLAQTQQLNIVASNDIDAVISITLKDVPLEEALTSILAVANYTWVRRNNIILITSLQDSVNLPADVQGRQIQVFNLDFVAASSVSETIQNFLSPIGKVSVCSSSHTNNRQTQERIVVEDLPESLARIATYIAQIDHPPRQVLIEAHVLQVNLSDTNSCGVNFDALFRIAGANANIISIPNLATPLPTPGVPPATPSDPAFLATINGHDLQAVISMLARTNDTKTLGSPKLLVLNEQEARLQVGKHLGFKTSTTTDTSTIQNVQFLDVGVVLRITPRITRDGCVLLHVKPEVSDGDVNPETGLPESNTAELETDVMLADGQGMIIGGLIKENDSVQQEKTPYLGNVRGLGWLFRHSQVSKERDEIIVALIPRIQPYDAQWQAYEQGEWVKSSVPLFHGPLCRTDRPWDAVLPDGKRVQYPLVPPHPQRKTGYFHDLGPQYAVPPYPLPEQHLYNDAGDCEPSAPQLESPAASGPSLPEQELPLPQSGDTTMGGSHVISDQPTTPGANR